MNILFLLISFILIFSCTNKQEQFNEIKADLSIQKSLTDSIVDLTHTPKDSLDIYFSSFRINDSLMKYYIPNSNMTLASYASLLENKNLPFKLSTQESDDGTAVNITTVFIPYFDNFEFYTVLGKRLLSFYNIEYNFRNVDSTVIVTNPDIAKNAWADEISFTFNENNKLHKALLYERYDGGGKGAVILIKQNFIRLETYFIAD